MTLNYFNNQCETVCENYNNATIPLKFLENRTAEGTLENFKRTWIICFAMLLQTTGFTELCRAEKFVKCTTDQVLLNFHTALFCEDHLGKFSSRAMHG